jgi:anti-anti-sigma factor
LWRPLCGYRFAVIEIRHDPTGRSQLVVVETEHGSPRDLALLLDTAIGTGDVSLVIDLGNRDDASSDLLTVLHRTARRVRRLGGRISVVARQPGLRRLLDLTLVSRTLPVYETRDEALRSWS